MARKRRKFIPPSGVSLRVNVERCFSCCEATRCRTGHGAPGPKPDEDVAAATAATDQPFPPALPPLLKAPSPPASALLICVVTGGYVTATCQAPKC